MRIVFASIGSLGDLHPMLALGRAAARRGHEVVVSAAPGYVEMWRGRVWNFSPSDQLFQRMPNRWPIILT